MSMGDSILIVEFGQLEPLYENLVQNNGILLVPFNSGFRQFLPGAARNNYTMNSAGNSQLFDLPSLGHRPLHNLPPVKWDSL